MKLQPAISNENEIERMIPLAEVCDALNCSPRTLTGYLNQFNIPLSALSERNRGLLERDYAALLEKIRGEAA